MLLCWSSSDILITFLFMGLDCFDETRQLGYLLDSSHSRTGASLRGQRLSRGRLGLLTAFGPSAIRNAGRYGPLGLLGTTLGRSVRSATAAEDAPDGAGYCSGGARCELQGGFLL